jgi:hypothetical protein
MVDEWGSGAEPLYTPGTGDDLPGVEPRTFDARCIGNCSGGTITRSHTRSSVMGVPPITGLLLLRSVIIVQGATEGGEGAPPPNPSTAL